METLVATVLIVIIFMMCSMLLNSMFFNSMQGRYPLIKERMQQLKYEYSHDAYPLPYYEDYHDWEFTVSRLEEGGNRFVVFKAENLMHQKEITQKVLDEH